jgi:hypothetical protein
MFRQPPSQEDVDWGGQPTYAKRLVWLPRGNRATWQFVATCSCHVAMSSFSATRLAARVLVDVVVTLLVVVSRVTPTQAPPGPMPEEESEGEGSRSGDQWRLNQKGNLPQG